MPGGCHICTDRIGQLEKLVLKLKSRIQPKCQLQAEVDYSITMIKDPVKAFVGIKTRQQELDWIEFSIQRQTFYQHRSFWGYGGADSFTIIHSMHSIKDIQSIIRPARLLLIN